MSSRTPGSASESILQIQVPDVDEFYQHCLDGGQSSPFWRAVRPKPGAGEFALRDPDGFVWSVYQDKSGGQWTT